MHPTGPTHQPASSLLRCCALASRIAAALRCDCAAACPLLPRTQVDSRHHLKRTDFSEYTEVAIKVMNRLKEAKKMGR